MSWPYTAYFIINSLYNGTLVIITLLLLVWIFSVKLPLVHKQILIQAINCTLLVSAIVYILVFIEQVLAAYYSQVEYEQYAIINRIFGPYWFAWLIMFLGTFILPQLVWIKKFRNSISTAVVILFFYKLSAVLEFISRDLFNNSSWTIRVSLTFGAILLQLLIYLPVLVVIYFVISRRHGIVKAAETM